MSVHSVEYSGTIKFPYNTEYIDDIDCPFIARVLNRFLVKNHYYINLVQFGTTNLAGYFSYVF